MNLAKPVALAIIIVALICVGCAQKSEILPAQEWTFKLEKVWETRVAGEDTLLRPAEPRISDDGTLYLHDFERHISYIIDGNGKLVGTFAPRGNGEGEVSFYINCFTAGDYVIIGAPDKLHFYTKQGQFVKAVPNNLFVRFPLAFKDENEFWVAPGALGDAPEGGAVITHVNLTTGKETIVHEFARSDIEKKPTGGGVVIGLTPQIKMDYDRKANRIYYGKNSDTVIYSLTGDAAKIDSFSFNGTYHPVSETDKRDHFAKFNIPEERVASIVGMLPDRMTYYTRIEVIDGLVYTFSAEGLSAKQSAQVVNIFLPDGRHLYYGRIQVEEGWHIANPDNLQLGNGFFYAVQENDAGDRKVVKYKIALPRP